MSAVWRICIWGVVALLLAAVLVTGLFAGTGFADFDLGNLLPSFSIFSNHRYEGAEEYTSGGATFFAGTAVNAVEVNWIAGSVDIHFADTDQITFSETASRGLDNNERLHYRLKNGKLTIQYCKSEWRLFAKMPTKALVLILPRSLDLDSLDVESVSADISAGGAAVAMDALAVETVSGSVLCEGISSHRLDAESVSGSLTLSGGFEEINANTVSGEIDFLLYEMPRRLNAESVSGNVRLSLPENKGFTVRFESVSGRLRCPFADISSRGKSVFGDGSSLISIETVSGGAVIEMDKALGRAGNAAMAAPGFPVMPEFPAAPGLPAAPELPPEADRPGETVPSSGRKF